MFEESPWRVWQKCKCLLPYVGHLPDLPQNIYGELRNKLYFDFHHHEQHKTTQISLVNAVIMWRMAGVHAKYYPDFKQTSLARESFILIKSAKIFHLRALSMMEHGLNGMTATSLQTFVKIVLQSSSWISSQNVGPVEDVVPSMTCEARGQRIKQFAI